MVSVAGRRGHNEDVGRVLQADLGGTPASLLLVADGMGGHALGEVASRLAADALADRWPGLLGTLRAAPALDAPEAEAAARRFFAEAYAEAERRIGHEGGGNGMGTTLVAALVVGDRAMLANVGDSRGYVVRAGGAEQVTEDHSVVADAVRQGALTPEEAEASPYQHALTRALDGTGPGEPDLYPQAGWLPLAPAGAVLLCSDGLSGVLEPADLHAFLAATPDLGAAARALAAAAYERGSPDNVTLAVVEHGALPRGGALPLAPDRAEALLAQADAAPEPPSPEGAPEAAREVQPRESVGRTPWVLGAVALLLVAAALVVWFSRDDARSPEAPLAPVVRGPSRPVPSAFTLMREGERLRWEIAGIATRDDTVRIRVAYPPDTLARTIVAVGSTLSLGEVAAAWPAGVLPRGEYVWRVEARSLSGSRLRSAPEPLILERDVPALSRGAAAPVPPEATVRPAPGL